MNKPLRSILFSLALIALPMLATAAVNINQADANTIAEGVTGIGPSKAVAIVHYREQNGGFKSLDELTQIRGIGEKTLQKIRPQISLGTKQ